MEQLHDTSSPCAIWPHFAFLCLSQATSVGDDWLACCYRVTPRVERLSATAVTLDVGICTDSEAQRVLCALMRRLDTLGVATRVGIAPSPALAQLALLAAPPRQRLVCVSLAEARALVRRLPVTMLVHLLPCSAITVEVVARLQRYGLRTLEQVATLSEQALRQQFGRAAGVALAALAQSRDPLPFCPTPAPQRLHFRLRCAEAFPPQRVLAALPVWAEQIAATLEHAQLAVREVRLVVGWADGRRIPARTVLRQHAADAGTLLAAVQGLLLPLLQHADATDAPGALSADTALLDSVRLTLLDVAPIRPAQHAFWRMRAQRRETLGSVADALARRYGRSLVLCAHHAAPAAIFPEERYRLVASTPAHAAQPASPSPVSTRTPRGATSWDDIPHRLHWW